MGLVEGLSQDNDYSRGRQVRYEERATAQASNPQTISADLETQSQNKSETIML